MSILLLYDELNSIFKFFIGNGLLKIRLVNKMWYNIIQQSKFIIKHFSTLLTIQRNRFTYLEDDYNILTYYYDNKVLQYNRIYSLLYNFSDYFN